MKRRRRTGKQRLALFIEPLSEHESGRGVRLPEIRKREIQDEILRLITDGYTQGEICAALRITQSRASRWARHAVLNSNGPITALKFHDRSIKQLMWDRIEVSGRSDCWNWKGNIKANGYGSFNYQGKCHQAHRLVYQTLVGEIHDGLVIDHKCSNRRCVNPDHLQVVTQSVNILLSYARRNNAA